MLGCELNWILCFVQSQATTCSFFVSCFCILTLALCALVQIISYTKGSKSVGSSQFKGRVGFTETMPSYNVSLYINNTQESDSGRYLCQIISPDNPGLTAELSLDVKGKKLIQRIYLPALELHWKVFCVIKHNNNHVILLSQFLLLFLSALCQGSQCWKETWLWAAPPALGSPFLCTGGRRPVPPLRSSSRPCSVSELMIINHLEVRFMCLVVLLMSLKKLFIPWVFALFSCGNQCVPLRLAYFCKKTKNTTSHVSITVQSTENHQGFLGIYPCGYMFTEFNRFVLLEFVPKWPVRFLEASRNPGLQLQIKYIKNPVYRINELLSRAGPFKQHFPNTEIK